MSKEIEKALDKAIKQSIPKITEICGIPVVRLSLALLGPVGSAISSTLDGVANQIMETKIKNLRFNIAQVSKKIKMIEKTKLDYDFFKTQDFLYLFENFAGATANARSNKKLEMVRNAFINGIVKENKVDKFHIIDCVSELEEEHAIILSFIYQDYLAKREKYRSDPTQDDRQNFITLKDLEKGVNSFPTYLLEKLCEDLLSLGILEDAGLGRYDYKPRTMYTVTSFGVVFCKKIIDLR